MSVVEKAANYCRISTDHQEREDASLDTQMEAWQVVVADSQVTILWKPIC